ncbi:MAG: hypothetical protein IKJ01_05890 [Lachnospiraceae bacterium]|nr:hypothetical protein [Lachnospiraceae bacterium]
MEWKKVWKKKKVIAIFIVLLFIQIFFFLYLIQQKETQWERSWGTSYHKTQQKKEAEYIQNFYTSIESIIKQADSMSGISIFAQNNSFSNRNLEQTKADFLGLMEITPILFENEFLTAFFSDKTQNSILLICIAILAFVLVDEKKQGVQGLRCMIFASYHGRSHLILHKIIALAIWTMLLNFVFYGGTFVASCIWFRQNPISYMAYPIQSLSMFSNLPVSLEIGSFLLYYFLYRCFLLFGMALFLWTILFCIDNILFSATILGSFGGITYIVYKIIESNHSLNILHYCNPWYLFSGCTIFTEYKNLNIFEYAINKNSIIFYSYLFFILLWIIIAFVVGTYKYPCASFNSKINRIIKKCFIPIKNRYRNGITKLSITGMEYYKVLVSQRGIIILFIFIAVFIYQADFTNILLSAKQEKYFAFVKTYEGIPNAKSEQEIEELKEMLAEVKRVYEEAQRKYEKGEIESEEWIEHILRYEAFEQDRKFLEEITEQTEYLENLKETHGISGWYVNQYSFNQLLNEGNTLVNLWLIFGIILLCSGIFASEKKHGMISVLRGTVEGRSHLFKKKMGIAITLTIILFAVTSAIEIGTVAYVYGLSGFFAPVQSILLLQFFPMKCNIGTFFIGLYLIKAIILLSVTAFTCMFSIKTSQFFTIGVSFVLCVPTLLYMIGFDIFRYISVTDVLLVAPFLLQTQNIMIVIGATLFFLVLGIQSIRKGYQNWIKNI